MLKVRTQKLGGVAILCLQGRMAFGETEELSEAVRSQSNASMVVLDFAQVELIDAGGLGVLLRLREVTESRGTEFRLINVNRLVQQMLELTRLDSVFKVSSRHDGRSVTQDIRVSGKIDTLWPACAETQA